MIDPYKPGIYIIENTITFRVYVGSSTMPQGRWSRHKKCLDAGTHCNNRLQNSWNYHGESAFRFQVLFNCSKEELVKREQETIDSYYEVYNVARKATPGPYHQRKQEWTPERREKKRQEMLGNTIRRGRKTPRSSVEKGIASRKGKTIKRGEEWHKKIATRMSKLCKETNHLKPQNQKGYKMSGERLEQARATLAEIRSRPGMKEKRQATVKKRKRDSLGRLI